MLTTLSLHVYLNYDVMFHAMTFILSDKEVVFCFANQLKRMLKNTSSETLAPMGISDDIEVVVILEINQKDDRSQCISVKFDIVCRAQKYAARSVFCSVVFCYFLV